MSEKKGRACGKFKQAWEDLSKRHEDQDTADKADRLQECCSIKMNDDERPEVFIGKLKKELQNIIMKVLTPKIIARKQEVLPPRTMVAD